MKILVTGANGYLGQGIVKEILDCGHEVIATDNKIDEIDSRAKCNRCDIFTIETPFDYFDNPDVLLHLAWKDGFVHNSDAHIDNISNHYNFLKKMFKSGIKRIAVMGSMHEIGFYEGSISEETECNPISLYGISKNTLRGIVQLFSGQENVPFQWLRGFYIVGKFEYGSSIFSKITKASREGKKVFPFTHGQNQYDFLDYQEFCKQVTATVLQNEITGIINICSGKPEKLADRVERFITDNGFNIKLNYGAFPDRPYDSKAVWGNDTKIKEIMKNAK